MERERLGSRLGFILLSAGCAIGCGNVWKFPWMCGQNGGGAFVLFYILFLVILGLPVMVMEFSVGRASQASAVKMHRVLEPEGTKWHFHGVFALVGNIVLMMFYTSVAGWILYYFVKSISGSMVGLSAAEIETEFGNMMASPGIMVGFMAIVVVLGFFIVSVGLQGGLERVTKVMMIGLIVLIVMLVVHSLTLSGAKEGLAFYLVPDLSKVTGETIVGAMNQAFFTLSLGIGSMAIFGSYINKERTLLGESVNVIILDTFVAIMAGLIIFPACFTFDVEVGAGPSLLFVAMANVFSGMTGGQLWGTLFFLFMFFAAMSTVLAVFETIQASVNELTGWSRRKTSIICCIGIFVLSIPCALGFNVLSGVHPFGMENLVILDLEDFLVSNCLLPLGSLLFVLFCTWKNGWGWDNFRAEANSGKGLKFTNNKLIRGYITYILPLIILVIFVIGVKNFFGW